MTGELTTTTDRLDAELPEIGPEYAELFERALPYLQTRENEVHTRISYGYAERLLRHGGRRDVVLPAILLHDVGWSRVPEDLQLFAFGPNPTRPELRDVHEEEGARLAEGILRELGYAPESVAEIVRIIAGHDSKPTCDSLEEGIVKDADKLFRFSRRGFRIIRDWYPLEERGLLERLEDRIPDWFLTAPGATLAREEAAARRKELSRGL
ncbi:MAG: HD domain-containing protein [Deltaproteobacteria bacterium]|nr:HD domain-containing protein [Deltaproteobacteria bacterium]